MEAINTILQKRLDASLKAIQQVKAENARLFKQYQNARKAKNNLMVRYKALAEKHRRFNLKTGNKYDGDSSKVRLNAIYAAICKHFGISEIERAGISRKEERKYPRQLYVYLAYTMTPASLTMLAEEMGYKDHTSIINARDRIKTRYQRAAEWDTCPDDIDAIKQILTGYEVRRKKRNGIIKTYKGRPVELLDDKGKVLAEYPSIVAAAKAEGISHNTIKLVLSGKIFRSKYGQWRYKNQLKAA